jgi:tRNA(Ile)-lysidine synthase
MIPLDAGVMDALLQRVQQTIRDYRMLEPGHTVLVAVSGGADSMALLHILWRLREPLALQLWVAHLNHQMRPDAGGDARLVETVAGALGLRYVGATRDVPAYRRLHKGSPEDAARRVRYAFLRATATEVGAERIAIGHTADDQAETVLLHLLRGAGLRGLCGMPAVRGAIVRPLIQVVRRDILAYVQAHHLSFRDDPSNTQRRYRRNRLRLDVLPVLQQHFNPRLSHTLARTAQLLAEDEAALQALTQQYFCAAARATASGAVALQLAVLASLPIALQRRVFRWALAEVIGDLHGLTARHIAAIVALTRSGAGNQRLTFPRGVVVERRYDLLLIHQQAATTVGHVAVPLPVPGACRLDELGVTITTERLPRHAVAGAFPSGDVTWLDADRLGSEVMVRTRRAGDRFQPLGSRSAKKLKAFLIDAKIPRALRDRLPLVATGRGIAWVAGVRPAEWAKVGPETATVLRLQVLRHVAEPILGAAWEPR